FFAVMIEIMTSSHILNVLQQFVHTIFQWFSLPTQLSDAVISGIFEVTLGAKEAGEAGMIESQSAVPLVSKVAIAALIISWGGLSVHAQIVGLLHQTDLRYSPFLFARLIHAVFSCLIVFLLWDFLMPFSESLTAALPVIDMTQPVSVYSGLLTLSTGLIRIMLGAMIITYLIQRLTGISFRQR